MGVSNITTRLIIVVLLLHQSFFLLSQTKLSGIPFIKKYEKDIYNAGAQNWDSQFHKNGHIFIANNSGTLEFNGEKWSLHKLPNNSINRSICISDIGRIYAGGQDEVGYFVPNEQGTLSFTSIRDHIPLEFLPLEDVWQIKHLKSKIYFLSVNRVYIFDEITENIEVIDPKDPLISLIKYNENIYYYNLFKGAISAKKGGKLMPNSDFLIYSPVLDILNLGENKVFICEKNGIFIESDNKVTAMEGELHSYLIKNKVFSSLSNKDGGITIGTKFGGVIIADSLGNITQIIDNAHGLSNNNAQTLTMANQNLWVGTSNGINFVELNNPLKIIQPDEDTKGTFYDIIQHNNKLYFGSNNGLYHTDLNQKNVKNTDRTFKMTPGSQGQVWGLNIVGDDLLMGHNNGAFVIENDKAKLISNTPGAWTFLEANNENEMYVGTYEGVNIYKKINDKWQFYKKLEGFIESSRILISVKPMELWVSHPYRGVYKITHDHKYFVKKVELYDEKHGLPSNLLNYIFDINGTPYVTGKTGIYFYNQSTDKFELDPRLNKVIDNSKNVRRLYLSPEGKLWYIAEHEVGYLELVENEYKKTTIEELNDVFVDGFEKLFFYGDNLALACTDNNILTVDISYNKQSKPPTIFINKVSLPDSTLFGGYALNGKEVIYNPRSEYQPELEYTQNGLYIEYCSPEHYNNVLYSYSLIGGNQEKTWSQWTTSTSKEYNNLSHGLYTFSVKAKSTKGIESEAAVYTFKIKTPWYLNPVALACYWLVALSGLAALIFIPRKKYAKEKQILTIAIEESDANLEQIKNEKLEAEINFKNSELASATMHLVQKNETISKVRQQIQNVTKNIKDQQTKKEIKKVLSTLSDDERVEDDWENFSRHFDQVHTDFLKRLSIKYVQLTPKDKKLCAYLRMNLTTKEIAPLLNISVRGVEISRYRLRKKIQLEGDKNLNEFMMDF